LTIQGFYFKQKEYKFVNSFSSTPEFNFELLEKYILNYENPTKVPSKKGIDLIKELNDKRIIK